MNPEARQAFNTLHNLISSPDIQNSCDTQLHAFLKADGNPRPQTANAKSSSAVSRMLNYYALPAFALLRESRAMIQKQLQTVVLSSKKRRPAPELMIDLTTLEKTGAFKDLAAVVLQREVRFTLGRAVHRLWQRTLCLGNTDLA